MRELNQLLLPETGNTVRRATFFNTIAATLDAVQSMILFAVVTRVNGVEVGGVFSISMAIAYQMITIGKFGMRNFQATDIVNEFSFSTYFQSRLITSFIMLVWLGVYFLGYVLFELRCLQ